jgi:hypothetical protein
MLIKHIKDRHKRNMHANIWKLTDEVIKIKDVVPNITPEFSSRYIIEDSFVCMRDLELNNTCIYIKEEDVEKFKEIKLVYDYQQDLVNLTILKKYIISKDAYSVVANRSVPAAVNIKLVYYCNIMNINLYIEKTFRLQQDATLFKNLLNFENLKFKHNLK